MKNILKYMHTALILLLTLLLTNITEAQMAKMSFSNAYNTINPVNQSVDISSASNKGVSINMGGYTHKVKVGYGIPMEIALEYAVVKSQLSSEIASNPANYFNSSDDVQQAFSNLAYGDFVKISSYNQVNVVLNFRFNPPKLNIYGNLEEEFLNNSNSSPYDPAVYRMPSTPVRGTKILVIKK